MTRRRMVAGLLTLPRFNAGTLLLAVLLGVLLSHALQATAGEPTPEAAMDQTLKAVKSHDAPALRTMASPDLEQASPALGPSALGQRWASHFGGFTPTEPPTFTATESDSFVLGQVRGARNGELETLRILLHRNQNGRWFVDGIDTK